MEWLNNTFYRTGVSTNNTLMNYLLDKSIKYRKFCLYIFVNNLYVDLVLSTFSKVLLYTECFREVQPI